MENYCKFSIFEVNHVVYIYISETKIILIATLDLWISLIYELIIIA